MPADDPDSPASPPTRRPTRRLFFALWPDATTRAALTQGTRKAVRRSGGRPVPPYNYHITLAFLGNQPEALFDDIVCAGSNVAAAPVELTLDRFGYFPKPRVFWIGSTERPPEPGRLAGELWDRMEELGLRRDQRPFQAHVTLARKVAALPEVPPPNPLIWRASSFALIESVTEPQGAVYTAAHEFSLGSFSDPNGG